MSRAVTVLSAMLLVMAACLLCARRTREEGVWRCPPLPETFQESDLIGTWQTEYGGGATDTLTLREDGTYKQVYIEDTDGYSFEGSWNRWWLERKASGGLYLHLEGMRRCDFIDELCYKESGGGGDVTYWDFCESRSVRMPGEVVIMVTGVPEHGGYAPRGIWLWHMALEPGGGGGDYFTLQELSPPEPSPIPTNS